jgi:hypothetical protein
MKANRPSPQSIRKAFGQHLTVDVNGYEQTVWDILNWLGIDEVCQFLQDQVHKTESVGVHSDYERMIALELEASIKQMALKTGEKS